MSQLNSDIVDVQNAPLYLLLICFLWILIWQSLSHFNCVLFCEVYVTEWENNSFYCFSYELIYKLIKDFYQSNKPFFAFGFLFISKIVKINKNK